MVTGAWGNTIVGHIQDASGHHGFIYDGTTWTTIDKPGATSTIIYGTNGSKLVGEYYESGSGNHGFSYDGTTWTTIDKPWVGQTLVNGIYGNKIFGRADIWQADIGGYGFIYDGTTWTTLAKEGAHYTEIKGISGKYIVGNYMQPSNVWHGFLYDGTMWSTWIRPGQAIIGESSELQATPSSEVMLTPQEIYTEPFTLSPNQPHFYCSAWVR